MEQNQLSDVEAQLYDRQIRLWGIESQEKLRNADILIIGVRGLGSEILKNILLAGVNTITILDDSIVDEQDTQTNFLLNGANSYGKKMAEEVLMKAQALNPLVKLKVDTEPLNAKPTKYFKDFTIVVAIGTNFDDIINLDNICRELNIKFICGDASGLFGFALIDFQEHCYHEDRIQLTGGIKRNHDGDKKVVKVQDNISYSQLEKILILPETKGETNSTPLINRRLKPDALYLCMLTLIEFKRRFGRNPLWKNKEDDIEELEAICESMKKLYGSTNLSLSLYYNWLFGQVSPVFAILGGIISQEIIKAVSQKEVTINNIFLFDPLTYSGNEYNVKVQ